MKKPQSCRLVRFIEFEVWFKGIGVAYENLSMFKFYNNDEQMCFKEEGRQKEEHTETGLSNTHCSHWFNLLQL